MKKLLSSGLSPSVQITGLVILFLSKLSFAAGMPDSFDEARRISAESGKPLLIEFYRVG